LSEIHENAGQVKQTCEPAGDEDDVKGFDPEHALKCRVKLCVSLLFAYY
jgi:hypothetical protein